MNASEDVWMTAFDKVSRTHTIDYHYAVDAVWRKMAVAQALYRLRPIANQFDAIAVRGMSGATVGAIIAHALGKDLIIVRKPDTGAGGESSHAYKRVEGPLGRTPLARYLIVDDFTGSGITLDTIKREIGESATYIGHYLYRDENITIANV